MSLVGLVTLFEGDNYGTCLQAYALQESIRSLGYNAAIIRNITTGERNKANYPRNIISKGADYIKERGFIDAVSLILSRKYTQQRKQKFYEFRNERLIISNEVYETGTPNYSLIQTCDAFVCGSDMIWSDLCKHHSDFFFLQFVDKTKRIAYAPSTAKAYFTDEDKAYYRNLTKDFSALSCREKNGAKFLEVITGRAVEYTLDPTLLLSMDDWVSRFDLKDTEEEPYVLCYVFRRDKHSFERIRKEICTYCNAKLRYIPTNMREYLHEKAHGAYGPKEFLEAYMNAHFVITDTFHGLIFALIFQKPFILLNRRQNAEGIEYEMRMKSLLRVLGIEHRAVNDDIALDKQIINMDYYEINSKLEELRQSSHRYLELALRNVVNA